MSTLDYGPAATLARLQTLFPRGRFARGEDGTPVLVARSARLAGCDVYEQAPGRLLALSYVGSPRRWLNRLGDLVVGHLAGDGEGILHVRWCGAAAERLRAFSRGRQTPPGTAPTPPLVAESGRRSRAPAAEAPEGGSGSRVAPAAPGGGEAPP